jgi:hypothetical protein
MLASLESIEMEVESGHELTSSTDTTKITTLATLASSTDSPTEGQLAARARLANSLGSGANGWNGLPGSSSSVPFSNQDSSSGSSAMSPVTNEHVMNLHALASSAISAAAGENSSYTPRGRAEPPHEGEHNSGQGFHGVSAYGRRWQARISDIHIGSYGTREEAAAAYDRAARAHGADCNYPTQEEATTAANAAAAALANEEAEEAEAAGILIVCEHLSGDTDLSCTRAPLHLHAPCYAEAAALGGDGSSRRKIKKRRKCPHNRERYR